MKRRLFRKFLIGSWITLALVALGNGVLFRAAATRMFPMGEAIASRYAELELSAAAFVLQTQVLPASILRRCCCRCPCTC